MNRPRPQRHARPRVPTPAHGQNLTTRKRPRPPGRSSGIGIGVSGGTPQSQLPPPSKRRRRTLKSSNRRDRPGLVCRTRLKCPAEQLKIIKRAESQRRKFKLIDAVATYSTPNGATLEAIEYCVYSVGTMQTYFVEIQKFPRCSCMSFVTMNYGRNREKKLSCKHIVWILKYVLKLPENLHYQWYLTDDQLDQLQVHSGEAYDSELIAEESIRQNHFRFVKGTRPDEVRAHFKRDRGRMSRRRSLAQQMLSS